MSARQLASIWIHPRRTIREIVIESPRLNVTLFACLAGVGEVLDRATMRDLGDRLPLGWILGLAVGLGPVAGLVSLEILSRLVRWVGKWLLGVGDLVAIRAALAWASVPSVVLLPLWVPKLVLFGGELFQSEMPSLEDRPVRLAAFLLFAGIECASAIWSLVIVCNTVAEVQGFRSAWRGLLNLLLPGMLVLAPLILLGVGWAWLSK